MNLSPITIQPWPLPRLPIPIHPGNGNGGIVPPWLQRDLGHEATHVTRSASIGAYLVTR